MCLTVFNPAGVLSPSQPGPDAEPVVVFRTQNKHPTITAPSEVQLLQLSAKPAWLMGWAENCPALQHVSILLVGTHADRGGFFFFLQHRIPNFPQDAAST